MVLVLFFLGIIILITIIIILNSILWIQIDINNFKFYKEEKARKIINDDYEILVYGYIYKKIKIFKYKINSKKMSNKYVKKIKNKMDFLTLKSFFSNNFDISNIKNIELEKLNLNLSLSTENVILTSGIVTISNIIISYLLSKLIIKYEGEKYKYEVKPIYEDQNKINLFLETKIRFKLFSLISAFKSYSDAQKYQKEKNIIV